MSRSLENEVAKRFGVLNFFLLAACDPTITA